AGPGTRGPRGSRRAAGTRRRAPRVRAPAASRAGPRTRPRAQSSAGRRRKRSSGLSYLALRVLLTSPADGVPPPRMARGRLLRGRGGRGDPAPRGPARARLPRRSRPCRGGARAPLPRSARARPRARIGALPDARRLGLALRVDAGRRVSPPAVAAPRTGDRAVPDSVRHPDDRDRAPPSGFHVGARAGPARLALRAPRDAGDPRLRGLHVLVRPFAPLPRAGPAAPPPPDRRALRAASGPRGHQPAEPDERHDRAVDARGLGRHRRPGGADALVDAGGPEDRVGARHRFRVRLPALDGAPGRGGPPGGDPLDRRLRRRHVFLHGRERLPERGPPVPMSPAGEARLLLLGWNFRTAALAVRERVAFSGDELREALDRVRSRGL